MGELCAKGAEASAGAVGAASAVETGTPTPPKLRANEWVELLYRQPKVRETKYQTDRNQAANYANRDHRDEIGMTCSAILWLYNRLKFGWWGPVFHRIALIGIRLSPIR